MMSGKFDGFWIIKNPNVNNGWYFMIVNPDEDPNEKIKSFLDSRYTGMDNIIDPEWGMEWVEFPSSGIFSGMEDLDKS